MAGHCASTSCLVDWQNIESSTRAQPTGISEPRLNPRNDPRRCGPPGLARTPPRRFRPRERPRHRRSRCVRSGVAAFKPIPDSLWLRLAALEPRWSFCLWRERQWLIPGAGSSRVWSGVGGPPSPTRMVWRVRIFPAGSAEIQEMIDVAEPHLADGLEAAVAAAERRDVYRSAAPAPEKRSAAHRA